MALLSISAGAADKPAPFRALAAADYPAKVSFDDVVVAAEPFDDEAKTQTAFGKLHPPRYGVLPILVVIENKRAVPLDVRALIVRYRARGEQEIDATPAAEVRYAGDGPTRPRIDRQPFPIPVPTRQKKNPLSNEVIEQRAFAAKMIAPGESASGFVYFQTDYHGQVMITLSGLRDSATARDLFFFEIPLTHR